MKDYANIYQFANCVEEINKNSGYTPGVADFTTKKGILNQWRNWLNKPADETDKNVFLVFFMEKQKSLEDENRESIIVKKAAFDYTGSAIDLPEKTETDEFINYKWILSDGSVYQQKWMKPNE